MAPSCGCLPHFRKEREGEDRKRPSQGGQASGRPPDLPSSRLLEGPFLQEAFEMHFICDSGYRSVGLHDFFQKGVCSINEAWLPGEPLQEEWGACHVHLSPAGRTVRPPASPVTPEREAPRSHCGVQSQGRPSGSHRGWLCPPGDVRQCLETVLVVTPGGGTPGSQWVEARCCSAALSPGQACPQSELPTTMPAVPRPRNSSRTQILQLQQKCHNH